jgi:hypothetical protein
MYFRFLIFFLPLLAQAQDIEPFTLDPNYKGTQIEINEGSTAGPLDGGRVNVDLQNPNSETSAEDPLRWNRFAGGFWGSMTNRGIARSIWKVTSDTVLKNASEFGFGAGGQLDFGMPNTTSQSFRIRFGLLKVGITADAATQALYAASDLENSASLFHLAFLYRWTHGGWNQMLGNWGTVWYGIGSTFNYVFASSRPGQGGSPASHLANSYGFHFLGAIGADIPVSDNFDLTPEFDWHPLTGYTLLMGFRTSL